MAAVGLGEGGAGAVGALRGARAVEVRVWTRHAALWWNAAGVLILVNVVVHAQLAAPTPFCVFRVEPPVTFIAYVPWIWLPAFLVPLRLGHAALSIRQLWRNPSAARGGATPRGQARTHTTERSV